MATVTPINRPRGQTCGGVAAVLKYVMQEHKTEYEGRHLVTAINCQPETCCTEFISTKLQYNKCDGKMYFHFVQSFHPEENITPEKAHEVALELAQQWKDYELIVSTHTDAAHIHSHFIINSVSFETGKKLHFVKEDLTQLRTLSDEICLRHGLSICQPKKQQTSGIKQAEYHAAMRGESWKVALAIQIDECMKYAVNKEQFIELMESEGYQVKWTDSRANITYTTPDGKSCRDYRLHDTKYLKENMDYEFKLRAKEYAAYHGRNAGYAESGAAPQHGQGREHPEVDHADGRKLDGPDQRGGADRTVGPEAAGERGASAHGRADGRDAQRTGATASGRAQHGSNCDAEGGSGTEREQCQTSETGSEIHDGQPEHHAPGAGDSAEGVRETGWESQRGLLFQALQGDRFSGGFRKSSAVAAVPADRRSGAVGIGAASVLTGLSAMDSESDDPEERRRLIDARESAQNFGAIAGLAAGLAIAAHKAMQADPMQPETTNEPETPDMDGPVMRQTM
ncbi:MAG: relaxase/mobilization nuclease domain-containing protein [Firmicutes bacterium]|nr:relaxase/mobilization nuclease domain-containing protein [Bacillota bacterium]